MKKESNIAGELMSNPVLRDLLIWGGASFTIPFLFSLIKHVQANKKERKRLKEDIDRAMKEIAEDELMHSDIRDFLLVPEERVKKAEDTSPIRDILGWSDEKDTGLSADIWGGSVRGAFNEIIQNVLLPAMLVLGTIYLGYKGWRKGREKADELANPRALDDPAIEVLNSMRARYTARKLKHILESMDDEEKEKYGKKFEIKIARDEAAAVAALIAGPCSREVASGKPIKKASDYTINDIAAACLMKISDPEWKSMKKEASITSAISSFADSLFGTGEKLYLRFGMGLPLALAALASSLLYLGARSMADPEGEVRNKPTRKDLYKLLAEVENKAGIPLVTPHFTLPKDKEVEELAQYLRMNPSGRITIRMKKRKKEKK